LNWQAPHTHPALPPAAFQWDDFAAKNNAELNDNLGNFINRTLKFCWARWVPDYYLFWGGGVDGGAIMMRHRLGGVASFGRSLVTCRDVGSEEVQHGPMAAPGSLEGQGGAGSSCMPAQQPAHLPP
jgi:hypothetical protein